MIEITRNEKQFCHQRIGSAKVPIRFLAEDTEFIHTANFHFKECAKNSRLACPIDLCVQIDMHESKIIDCEAWAWLALRSMSRFRSV